MLVSIIRPIPPQALAFVKAHEGCKLTAYLDSVGVPTTGYGHTGPGIALGQTISQEQADSYLAQDLATAAQRLETQVGEACINALTDNQYAALLSFTFNLGTGPKPKAPKEWGIWIALRGQHFDQVPSELVKFVYAGGQKLSGLVRRRSDETVLWSTDEPGSTPQAPPSSVTRAVDTPPAPVWTKPLAASKRWVAGLGATGLSFATAIAPKIKGGADQISDTLAPYVGKSDILAGVTNHLAMVSAAASVALLFFIWLGHREDTQK